MEEVEVTAEMIYKADGYVEMVVNLAKCVKGGSVYQHYVLFKDLLDEHVGWHVPKDEPPHTNWHRNPIPWWMRTEAAYDVSIEAVCHALKIPVSVGTRLAQRQPAATVDA